MAEKPPVRRTFGSTLRCLDRTQISAGIDACDTIFCTKGEELALIARVGVHEVDRIIRRAEGEDLGPIDFTPDLLMIRYHVDEYLPEEQWKSLLAGRDLRCPEKNSKPEVAAARNAVEALGLPCSACAAGRPTHAVFPAIR